MGLLEEIQLALKQEAETNTVDIVDIWCAGLSSVEYIVAIEEGEVVAVATIHGSEYPELHKLYVIRKWRRLGVARKLFNYVAQMLRLKGVDELCVEMGKSSLPFWQKTAPTYQFKQIEFSDKLLFYLYDKPVIRG